MASADKKFFICKHCGNILGLILDTGVPLMCCGEAMEALIPNTKEAATEKHIPAVTKEDGYIKVDVGSVAHPMTAEHNISFVYVETKAGGQRKALLVDGEPCAKFCFIDDEPVSVYAYCNLHGLWKTDL